MVLFCVVIWKFCHCKLISCRVGPGGGGSKFSEMQLSRPCVCNFVPATRHPLPRKPQWHVPLTSYSLTINTNMSQKVSVSSCPNISQNKMYPSQYIICSKMSQAYLHISSILTIIYHEKKRTKVKFYPEKRTKVKVYIESAEFSNSIKLDYKLNIPKWYCS